MIIDVHFHMLADCDVPGCRMSDRLKNGAAGVAANILLGTMFTRLVELLAPEHPRLLTSAEIRRRLLGEIGRSRYLDGAIVLAMDARWSPQGVCLFDDSDLIVTNDYVLDVVSHHRDLAQKKRLYAGASIHPARPDALAEIDRVKGRGAVLVKWVPSSQQIELDGDLAVRFAQRLAQAGLPLLCHAGHEGAIPVSRDGWRAMEDPARLERILETGATVIVAHCAAPYHPSQPNYVPTLKRMIDDAPQRGWHLYADISALLLSPCRGHSLRGFLRDVDPSRLVYGTDFPIPTYDLTFGALGPARSLGEYLEASVAGWLDKDVLFKRSLGIPPTIFENTANLLRLA